MAATLDVKDSLGKIVAEHPGTRHVFEKYNLDYCCNGTKNLETAAEEKDIKLEEIKDDLKRAIYEEKSRDDQASIWLSASMKNLIKYIVNNHHDYFKKHIPGIEERIDKVINAHGDKHGKTLNELKNTFNDLKDDIYEHLEEEEKEVFPYMRQLEDYSKGWAEKPQLDNGTLIQYLHKMQDEHLTAGNALEKIREITDSYTPPSDACPAFCGLYEDFHNLQDNLHMHIHLENNILFPNAILLEKQYMQEK